MEETYQKSLAHGARTFVEPDTLSLGEPPLLVKNALIHSPNGEIIEFIEEVDFDRSGFNPTP